jgi:hypothetical protein
VKAQDGDEIAALQHKTAMAIHARITWNTVQRQPTRKPVSGTKDDNVVLLEQFSFQNHQAMRRRSQQGLIESIDVKVNLCSYICFA